MARTLVVANQKGGVGKSTSVMNLGVALAEQGHRVLLIDLDPQGGLTAAFGLDSYDIGRSAYSLLLYDHVSLARVMRLVRPQIGLIPASIDLAAAEMQLVGQANPARRLRRALERSRIPFDFVVIDTPPGLGTLTANGLVASDAVLIPVQCQFLAMRGVRALMETVIRIQGNLNPGLALGGLFGTMYRPASTHAQEVVEELRQVFGRKMLRTLIHFDDVVPEAPVAGLSMLEYRPDHMVAAAYRALAHEVVHG